MANYLPTGSSNGSPNGLYNDLSNGRYNGLTNGLTNGLANGSPSGSVTGLPTGSPIGSPTGSPNRSLTGSPTESFIALLSDFISGSPSGSPSGSSSGSSSGSPSRSPSPPLQPGEMRYYGRAPQKSLYRGRLNPDFELGLNNRSNIKSHGYGMPPYMCSDNEATPRGEDNQGDPYRGSHGSGFRENDGNEEAFRRAWRIASKDDIANGRNLEEATYNYIRAKRTLTRLGCWTDQREERYIAFKNERDAAWERMTGIHREDVWYDGHNFINSDVEQDSGEE